MTSPTTPTFFQASPHFRSDHEEAELMPWELIFLLFGRMSEVAALRALKTGHTMQVRNVEKG